MHSEALHEQTRAVLDKISQKSFLKDWYLAGGTALAIQLGHRKSIDLDFFVQDFPNSDLLLSELMEFNPKVIQQTTGTVDLLIHGVQVSFMEYPYNMLDDFTEYEKIKMAGVMDIASMKISAISSRGSKKDFADLFFILKQTSLEELLDAFANKYKGVEYSKAHIFKSLVYFEDAEKDPDPDWLIESDWAEIKDTIMKATKEISSEAGL